MDIQVSNPHAIRMVAWAALTVLFSACGGGGSDGTTVAPPAIPPPTSLPTQPSISWAADLSQPQARAVTVAVMVPITASGIKQVDFFVDGVLYATSTNGEKQPGVSLLRFGSSLNTAPYSDGPHTLLARVTDNAGATAETPTKIVTFANNVSIAVALSPNQLFPTPTSAATGIGQLRINLATGALAGEFTLTSMTASAMHLHIGWPTISGTSVFTLNFDAATNRWTVPADATLTTSSSASQVNELLRGRLYVDAHSAAHPEGEVRGQLLMDGMSLAFAPLSGDRELPPVSSAGTGIVSVLENRSTQRFEINARVLGLNEVVAIGVYTGPGPATFSNWLYYLRADENGDLILSGDVKAQGYNTGTWFMNVLTAANRSGEIGGYLPVIPPP